MEPEELTQIDDMVLTFRDFMSEVIQWNSLAGNEPSEWLDERQKQVYGQEKYLIEEIEELFDAAAQDDVVEQLDAMIDILFVAVYLQYLRTHPLHNGVESFDDNDEPVHFIHRFLNDPVAPVVASRKLTTNTSRGNECLRGEYIGKTLTNAINVFGWDIVKEALQEVTRSNMSKFPQWNCDTEADGLLMCATAKYSDKHKDIAVNRIGNNWVIRSNNGRGKILKPNTFSEPDISGILERNHFLEQESE